MDLKLGERVKDSITGFEGIVVSRTEYLYGWVRVAVEGPSKPGEVLWFDEQRLHRHSAAKSGGPSAEPPNRDP